jgi:hypothetical protein
VNEVWLKDQNLTDAGKALSRWATLVGEASFARCLYNTAAETFRLSS